MKAFAGSKTLLFVKWCGFWERTCCSLAGWLPGFDTKPHYSCRNIFLLFRLTLSLNLIQKGLWGKRGGAGSFLVVRLFLNPLSLLEVWGGFSVWQAAFVWWDHKIFNNKKIIESFRNQTWSIVSVCVGGCNDNAPCHWRGNFPGTNSRLCDTACVEKPPPGWEFNGNGGVWKIE